MEPDVPGQYREHHIVMRTVAEVPNAVKGSVSASQVDQYLSQYLQDGWTLFNTHFLFHSVDGELMCWILIR
jgi:hypothetical protein